MAGVECRDCGDEFVYCRCEIDRLYDALVAVERITWREGQGVDNLQQALWDIRKIASKNAVQQTYGLHPKTDKKSDTQEPAATNDHSAKGCNNPLNRGVQVRVGNLQGENLEDNDVICPFCHEGDFDLIGLRSHLTKWCEVYAQTPTINL